MMALKLAAVCILVSFLPSEPVILKDLAPALADSTVNLAINLYKTMVKDPQLQSENILFSPVVLASSLGVMSMGAGDSTARQIKSILNIPLQDDKLHPALSELIGDVSNETARNTTWKIGNRLYGPLSVNFRDDFVQKSKEHYMHDHSKINFRDKRSVVQSINEWVSKTTNGKLAEVFKDIPGTDGAVFINAMYFKPHWDEGFHQQMVDKRGFLVSRSHTVSVPMMHRTGLYPYYLDEVNKLQIVEMPLAHNHASMIFIMPNHIEPLERLEKMLTKDQIHSWIGKLKKRAVAISLPRVSVDISHDLRKHLQELGLTEAGDKAKADFSGITGKKDLHLSSHLHATAIEWDIEGKPFDLDHQRQEEMRSPKLFYADHPFIFLVVDNKTNSILLIGRLIKPTRSGSHDEL